MRTDTIGRYNSLFTVRVLVGLVMGVHFCVRERRRRPAGFCALRHNSFLKHTPAERTHETTHYAGGEIGIPQRVKKIENCHRTIDDSRIINRVGVEVGASLVAWFSSMRLQNMYIWSG